MSPTLLLLARDRRQAFEPGLQSPAIRRKDGNPDNSLPNRFRVWDGLSALEPDMARRVASRRFYTEGDEHSERQASRVVAPVEDERVFHRDVVRVELQACVRRQGEMLENQLHERSVGTELRADTLMGA